MKQIRKIALVLLGSVFFLLSGVLVTHATTTTYNFNSDTLGQTPANTTVTGGTFEVANETTLGNSLRATVGVTGSAAAISLTNFASTTDYSVTWKEAYVSGGYRHGFVLRAQSASSTLVGVKQGYLFQINHPSGLAPNTVRTYILTAGAATLLNETALTAASPRWFRATVSGSTITLEYSNDGSSFTTISSVTNTTYTTGGVQYTAGYGSVGNDYVDDIVQDTSIPDTSAPSISSIAATPSTTSATVTWTTNEASSSQVDYGTTASYGSSTTLDASLVTSHSVSLSGLSNTTTYHYRVKSADAATNLGTSSDQTFTTSTPSNTIAITTPKAYQVFQRNGSNTATIAITGTYTGSPTAIEASWNGGGYQTIVASPSGNAYSGSLTGQTGGQGTLTVRFTNDTNASATKTYVGVGDVYVIAGQSNASGRGTSAQTYSHATLKPSLFGNDDTWKELVDPTDSNTGQVDSISDDAVSPTSGSTWPLLATYILADQSVPVAFVPTAKGGSSIYQWQKSTSSSVSNTDTTAYSSCSTSLNATGLYASMNRRIGVVGPVKAILFFQGETDAWIGTSSVSYTGYANCFISNVYTDFGVPTVFGMIDVYVGTATDANINIIRAAQKGIWQNTAHALPGAGMFDTNLSDEGGDGVHFKTSTELQTFATRWWAALKSAFYGGADDGRGPQIQTATYNTTKTQILLTFTDSSGVANASISASVFTVKNNGTPVTVSTATRISATQVRLDLAAAATGTITVSLASGITGYSGTMPVDASAYSLPAEPFTDMTTTLYDPDVTNPSVSLTAPTTGTTVSGASVTVSATASDNIGVSGVQFKLDGNNLQSEDTISAYSITWDTTTAAEGSHTLTAIARDAAWNTATASSVTVTVDNAPPLLSDISPGDPTTTTAMITWTTDEAADSQVEYGTTTSYGTTTTLDATLDTSHSVVLSGLASATLYHYRVISRDVELNTVTSTDQTFTTAANPSPHHSSGSSSPRVPTVPFDCLLGYLYSPTNGTRCPLQNLSTGGSAGLSATGNSSSSVSVIFTKNLAWKMNDRDVEKLQHFLNTHGFPVSINGPGSLHNETIFFGSATKAALIKFQKSNNIMPSIGYFGPLTRAFINKSS